MKVVKWISTILLTFASTLVFAQLSAPSVTGTTPTNNTKPTWNWTSGGGGNGTFRYKLDDNDLTSGTTETTDLFYTPATDLLEGNHTLYVQETDGTNWSTSGSYTITIDLTPPTITAVSIPNSPMKVNDIVTATITVSDDSGDTYTLNSGNINGFSLSGLSRTNSTTYTASFTVTEAGTDIPAGSDIPLSVVLTDGAGNSNTAYTSSISQNNDAIDANSPSITNVTIPNLPMKVNDIVTATITVSDDNGDTYTLNSGNINGFSLSGLSRTNSTTYTASFTVTEAGTDIPAGSDIPLSVVLTDGAGNSNTAYTSSISQDNDAIDANSPAKPGTPDLDSGSDNGSSDTDNTTNDNTPTFTGTTEASCTITLYSDKDGSIGTTTADVSGNWTFIAPTLSDNSHDISCTATDAAGNISSTSDILTITIDTSTPSAPTISEISSGTYNTNQTFSISGETNAYIEYSTDNGSGWNDYSAAVTLMEGDYNVTARQTDLAGNISSNATAISLTIDETTETPTFTSPATNSADDQSLSIDFTLPENATSGTVKMTFTYSSGTTDSNSPHIITFNSNFETSGQHVTDLNGEDLSDNVNVTSVSSNPYDALIDGTTYSVKIEYQDELGNTAASVTHTNFTYETASPTATIGPVTPDPRNSAVGNVSITFSKLVHITEVDISDFSLTNGGIVDITDLSVSNTPDINQPEYSKDFSINLSTKTTIAGNYTLKLTATGSGIYSRTGTTLATDASDSWEVDLTAPTVLISSSETSPTNASPIPITIEFSEPVNSFEINDITTGNATASNFNTVNDSTFTVDLTPSSNGNVTVDIIAGVCTDIAGNDNVVASQFAITYDNVAPTLSPVQIASNNSNPTYAKVGDIVKVTFTGSEELQDKPSVTIAGHDINSSNITNTSGNTWEATYQMTSGDTEGTVSFSIAFTDKAGNNGTLVTTTTDASSVEFYKNSPTLSSVSISSSNSNSNMAKVGDVITLNFQSGVKLANVTVTIANHSVTATNVSNEKVWTATYPMVSGDLEGTIPFTINFTDKPGNPGTEVTTTTNASSVTFDKTNPELNAVSIASNNSHSNWVGVDGTVTLTITGSENISITNAKINGHNATLSGSNKNWTASYVMQSSDTDGNVNFSINYTDLAGNTGAEVTSTTNASTVTFDKVAPTLTSVTISSNNTTNSLAKIGDIITILFTADDAIENVSATINTKSMVINYLGGEDWSAQYTMASSDINGTLSFAINFKDYAGNVGSQVTNTTDLSSVTFDKTAPSYASVKIYSNNPNPAYAKDGDLITLDFKTSESIQTPTVSINDVTATSITGGPTDWIATRIINSGESEGTVQFTIDIEDLAGNATGTRYSTSDGSKVTFDNTAPNISSITLPSGVYKVGSTISILITTDANTYTGTTVEVNGKNQSITPNGDNSYTVNYTIQENDNEISASATLPVNIVLSDAAGLTTTKTAANVSGGTVTIDSHTPQISSFASTAESAGILRVGNTITFTLVTVNPETDLTITPSTYNSKNINWTTTDNITYTAIYTVIEGDPEQSTPLNFGNVTVSDAAGNSDVLTTTEYNPIQKQIYTVKPTVTISGSKTKCYDGNNETISFQFTGKTPFDLWYNIDGVHHTALTINSTSYQIQIPEGTVALDSLRDASTNKTETAPANATVTVNPLPSVTLNITSSPYTTTSEKDELSQYVSPSDKQSGTFSGESVGYSNGYYYFYPSIVPDDKRDLNLPIIYSYTDPVTGCVGKDTSEVFVSSTTLNITSLKTTYCYNAVKDTVGGIIPDGYTGNFEIFDSKGNPYGSGWLQLDSITLVLDPTLMSADNYTVKYTSLKWPSLEKDSSISKSFTIEAKVSGLSFSGLDAFYCYNNKANEITFTVNGITNEVGDVAHFSGPTSVFSYTTDSHSAKFKYSQAEADANYTISYYYESRNGCLSDPISETVHINPLPELSFSLNNNYNYNTGSIPLVGNHTSTDYLFSGEGVARDTLFTSAARIGVPIVITYSYTDANGCNNQLLDTTTIYQAPKTIDNLQSVYCYSNSAINISCTPNISDTITGTFVSKRNALETSGKNTAIYYINRVGNGKDTVYFDYNYKGTDYSLAKEVLVDSIGNVFISGLDTSFCSSLTKVTIVGNQASSLVGSGDFSYSGSTQAFSEFGSSAELYPNKETQGTYSITYTFTSQNGCQSDTTMSFKVNAVPNVNFSVDRTCTDLETIPIVFTNLTTFGGTIEKWQWYLDGLGSVSSEEYNPSKIYTTGGAKQIRLTATTNQGCAASKDTILTIGTGTNAKFDWYNDCNSGIIPTQFVCTSDTDFIETYTWKVDNIDVNQDSKLMNYSFLKDTLYNVKLIVESIEHCRDSITKTVSISPVIKITDCTDNTYYQNFEDATDWLVKKEDETEYSSWNFGTPNGDIISNASSGDKAWFTNVNLNNQHVENSQIISPCFDFDTLSRPMLKFDMWSSPEEGRDGAVLQYSKDGGITWSSLGDVGQGINWFNSTSIKGQPADDYLGWSKSTNEWVSARHNLDSLKGSHLARFRIVYAADAQAIQEFNGFAFDNIWIGNKQQNVLAEYFTNTNLTDAEAYSPEILSAEQNKAKDVIPIHYHTSTPSGDPFYNYYSSGPSARVAYYGIPKTPYSIVNGTNEFSFPSGLTTSSYFDAFEDSIDVKSLYDPKVSINIEANNSSGNCTINVNLTTNQDLTGKKLLLQCAVVKTSIDSDGKTYYNVLRKFIPDAGGTEIDSNLGENNTQTITLSWAPSSNDELANAMLIAFIQDVSTKEIYQTVKYDLSVLTGITPANLDSFTYIYPNPASKYVIVNCKYSIRQIEVYDITGRTINIYTPNQQQVSIPVETLKNGVYIIKGTTDKGTFIKKLIKVQ